MAMVTLSRAGLRARRNDPNTYEKLLSQIANIDDQVLSVNNNQTTGDARPVTGNQSPATSNIFTTTFQ